MACAIVSGQSLMDFARTRPMRPATARMHLCRIYGKVGVATQPALVRVLLSMQPPR